METLPADLMDPAERPLRTGAGKTGKAKPAERRHGADPARLNEIVDEFGGFGGTRADDAVTSESNELMDFFTAVLPGMNDRLGYVDEITWAIIPVLNEDIDTINRARTRTTDGLRAANLEGPEDLMTVMDETGLSTATLTLDAVTSGTQMLLPVGKPGGTEMAW